MVSPYAKQNYVDHTLTDQTSILRFIEDNWLRGERVGGGSFDCDCRPDDRDVRLQLILTRGHIILNESTGVVEKQ